LRLGQHLRRIPGDATHARHVPEEKVSQPMSADVVALLYLVAGVLFILALRGLSSPETSRRGNLFGMTGMAIAIVTTLASHPPALPPASAPGRSSSAAWRSAAAPER